MCCANVFTRKSHIYHSVQYTNVPSWAGEKFLIVHRVTNLTQGIFWRKRMVSRRGRICQGGKNDGGDVPPPGSPKENWEIHERDSKANNVCLYLSPTLSSQSFHNNLWTLNFKYFKSIHSHVVIVVILNVVTWWVRRRSNKNYFFAIIPSPLLPSFGIAVFSV